MSDASAEGAPIAQAKSVRLAEINWLAWALPAAAVLLIAPLWLARLPAMPDFPAHLATFWLLSGGIREPHVAQFYRVEWAFVPNLAAETIVPLLGRVVSLLAATKIFLSLTIAMWIFGAGAVHKALYGRVGAAPLAASFFAYNANFMWGFFNYCFATALSFLVLAAWIASDGKRSALRLAGFAVAITVVYFCHLFAVAMLLLMIGCYELTRLWRTRPITTAPTLARLLPVFAIAIPAMLCFFLLKPHGADSGHLEFNLLSTLDDRASAAIQFTFDRPAYFLFVGLLVFFVVGLYRKTIALHPDMWLILGVLAAAAVFTPEWAMGGWGVDLRLPAVLGTLAFAACEFRFRERTLQGFSAAVMILLVYQAATLAGNWGYYSKQFSEFRAAIAAVPRGSKLMTVLDGDAMGLASDQPYWHMAEYGVIDRGDYTPLLFTTKGQHVVQLQPAMRALGASNAQQGSPPDIGELDDIEAGNVRDDPDIATVYPYLVRFPCHFDYAVVIHSGGRQTRPPDMLKLEHAGSFFSLYRILPSENCHGS